MDLIEYYAAVEKVNFFYQDIKNHRVWNDSRLYYEKILRLSWTSPDHRKIWLKIKAHKMVDKN